MLYRIFLSSPGDVEAERDVVESVVAKINGEEAGEGPFELIRWEEKFYTASQDFQAQIPRPGDCDLVVCIFWKRLGSDLPDRYRRTDGSLPTGTEFEFEDALEHATTSSDKLPDVLVYRKQDPVFFAEATADIEQAQRNRFLAFWNKWFRNEKGHFVAAFQNFTGTAQFEALIDDHLRQWLKRRAQPSAWTRGSPFRGLEAFDVEHAPVFFGRRFEIERARARLVTNAIGGSRFLLISGPSGSGKSSLARAGLIPRLAGPGGLAELAGSARWTIVMPAALSARADVPWRLEFARAFFAQSALAAELTLGDFDSPDKLAALLAQGGAASLPLQKALDRVARLSPGSRTALVLLVDQLEQLFQWPESEAQSFAAALEALCGADGIFVIATMRSDFLHRIDELSALKRLCGQSGLHGPEETERILPIGLPGPADLREMIAGPARAAGLVFGDTPDGEDLQALIEREASPASLPALQFLLSELYKRKSGAELTWDAYRELGGITGVMARRGEAVLAEVAAETAAAFPNLVRAMVSLGLGGTAILARPIHEETFPAESAERRLAAALRDAGLIISDNRNLRFGHDSLLRHWERLAAQVKTEQNLFESSDRLAQQAGRYAEAKAKEPDTAKGYFLQGLPLAEGGALLGIWGRDLLESRTPGLAGFIAESQASARSKALRFQLFIAGVSAIIMVSVMAAIWLRQESKEAKLNSDLQLYLARTEAALRERDLDRAVGSAAQAFTLRRSAETRSALLAALTEHSPYLGAIVKTPAAVAVWISKDELALVAADGTATVLNRGGQLQKRPRPEPSSDPPVAAATDGAGGFITVLNSGGLRHDRSDGSKVQAAPGRDAQAIVFSGQASLVVVEGQVSAATADSSRAILWRCALAAFSTCTSRPLANHGTAVALSPDGTRLALAQTGEAGRSVRLYEIGGETVRDGPVIGLSVSDDIIILRWSSDGRMLAGGTRDGHLLVMTPTVLRGGATALERPAVTAIAVSRKPVLALDWSPTAARLAYACNSSDICLADIDGAGGLTNRRQLIGSHRGVQNLVWNGEGSGLVSVHEGGEARFWRQDPERPIIRVLQAYREARLTSVASDAKIGTIAAGDEKGNIWLWPATATEPVAFEPPSGASGSISSLDFAADGALAAGYGDGFVAIYSGTTRSPVRVVSTGESLRRLTWTSDASAVAVPMSTGSILLVPREGDARLVRGETKARADGIAALPAGGLVTSHTDSSIHVWDVANDVERPLIDKATVADMGSALSLDIDPTGRWLVATRLDDQIKAYDLQGGSAPIVAPVLNRDTKTVAFSPDGRSLAALGSEGRLYLWPFDPAAGAIGEAVSIPGVPSFALPANNVFGRRPAAWLTWLDNARLAVATIAGDILIIDVSEEALQIRLDGLSRIKDARSFFP